MYGSLDAQKTPAKLSIRWKAVAARRTKSPGRRFKRKYQPRFKPVPKPPRGRRPKKFRPKR